VNCLEELSCCLMKDASGCLIYSDCPHLVSLLSRLHHLFVIRLESRERGGSERVKGQDDMAQDVKQQHKTVGAQGDGRQPVGYPFNPLACAQDNSS
jgi:hypothetical protein